MKKTRWVGLAFVVLLALGTSIPVKAGLEPATQGATDAYSLINAVNALRASNGLPGYAINPILMSVAQQHAVYMSAAGVTHYGPGGSAPWQRGLAAGYPLAGDLSLGGFYSENIIAGGSMQVDKAVAAWQTDAPHLLTMLSPDLQEIGAGVAIVGNYIYYVIDCARPTTGGKPQNYTPQAGGVPVGQGTLAAPPLLLVKTIIPVTPQSDGRVFHIVKPGETLWLIAISYGVKVVDLRRLNNLTDTQSIFPGAKLLVKQVATTTPVLPTPSITPSLSPTIGPTLTQTSTVEPSSTPEPAKTANADPGLFALVGIVFAGLALGLVFMRSARNAK